jgi:hypothetical protein
MHDPHRVRNFPVFLNTCDPGGYPTTDCVYTRWGSLIRSDDLAQLTPAAIDALGNFDVRTLIDLRWPEAAEHNLCADPQGISTRSVRTHFVARRQRHGLAIRLDCAQEMWKCAVLEHTRAELRQVLQAISAAPAERSLFHCVAGKDRRGQRVAACACRCCAGSNCVR